MRNRIRKAAITVFCLALAVLAAAGPAPASEKSRPPKLVFTTFPSSGMGMLFKRILVEAYDLIGYDVEVLSVPAERALAMSDEGLSDGEAARVAVIEDGEYPNLVRVPTPLYVNTVVGFTRNPEIDSAKGWDGLKPYRTGSVLGYKFLEKKAQGYGEHTLATCYHQLFAMLKNNRLDVALTEYVDVMPSLEGFVLGDIRLLVPPFARNPMYHYLHRKHADLVPKIDEVLARMKEEGRLDAILKETMDSFEAMQGGGCMSRSRLY